MMTNEHRALHLEICKLLGDREAIRGAALWLAALVAGLGYNAMSSGSTSKVGAKRVWQNARKSWRPDC